MKTEAIAHGVHQTPHPHLGLSSLTGNAAHIFAAPDLGEGIYHLPKRADCYPAAILKLLEVTLKQARRLSATARAKGGGKAFPT
jgi:hypothetical protein